jgi:hypothetical protein
VWPLNQLPWKRIITLGLFRGTTEYGNWNKTIHLLHHFCVYNSYRKYKKIMNYQLTNQPQTGPDLRFCFIKLIYSETATRISRSLQFYLKIIGSVQKKMQDFVIIYLAFSEYMNFTKHNLRFGLVWGRLDS